MGNLLVPHLLFKTATLFFVHHPLWPKFFFFIILSYITYVTRGQGRVGVLVLHLVVSTSAYIFSLGSFQHLPLSASALTLGFTPTPVIFFSSRLRSSFPMGRARLQMCINARLSLTSAPCASFSTRLDVASQTKTWRRVHLSPLCLSF